MTLRHTTLLISTAAMLYSGVAFAQDAMEKDVKDMPVAEGALVMTEPTPVESAMVIEQKDPIITATNIDVVKNVMKPLPAKGNIQLLGTVVSIRGENSFIFNDETGRTMDAETANAISFNEGERVVIIGTVEDEFLGLGQEIAASEVRVIAPKEETTIEANMKVDEKTEAKVDNAKIDKEKAVDTNADGEIDTKVETETKASVATVTKPVKLTGSVKELLSDVTFLLEDSNGDTIEVLAYPESKLEKGFFVYVEGTVEQQTAATSEIITETLAPSDKGEETSAKKNSTAVIEGTTTKMKVKARQAETKSEMDAELSDMMKEMKSEEKPKAKTTTKTKTETKPESN